MKICLNCIHFKEDEYDIFENCVCGFCLLKNSIVYINYKCFSYKPLTEEEQNNVSEIECRKTS